MRVQSGRRRRQALLAGIAAAVVVDQILTEVTQEWQQDQPLSGRTLGMVSPQAWIATLKLFGNFSLPFSVNSAKFSYANVVDMGPLNNAVQLDQRLFG